MENNLAERNLTPDAQIFLRQREHDITPFIIGGRCLKTNRDYPQFWAFMDSQSAILTWNELRKIQVTKITWE